MTPNPVKDPPNLTARVSALARRKPYLTVFKAGGERRFVFDGPWPICAKGGPVTVPLHFETIDRIGEQIRSGALSAEALTISMLDRISELNETVNAYITVTDDLALDQARQADAELRDGQDRGPLHGVPVAVKDLFATSGIRTTGGSKMFENWVPGHDATAVTRLREAGAVLLGKTGLHELAYGTTSINPFFGTIRNPWSLARDPGGSSGGSAAAVAAGMAFAALGTDTGCSIRQPAHCCGIVGHKPTFGLVSKSGVLPLAWSMDHVGPMARTVRDAATVLDAIAGYDPTDPYSVEIDLSEGFEPTRRELPMIRFGIVRRHFFDGYDEVVDLVDAAVDVLRENGAIVVDVDLPNIDGAFSASRTMFLEALALYEEDLRSRPEIFGADTRDKLIRSGDRSATDYAKAQHTRVQFRAEVEALFEQCDVLLAPTSTIAAAPIDSRPADYAMLSFRNTGLFDLSGHPSISVPCGMTRAGVPVGMMLTGPLFRDRHVLQVARACEEVLGMVDRHPELEPVHFDDRLSA